MCGDLRKFADKVARVTNVHDGGKLRLDIDSGANFWEADKLTLISPPFIPITDHDLDFWIASNQNVLMIGLHGIGKTARIVEAFKRNNLNWKYFSASTMDPWVDFIGIPRSKTDENGNEYLDLLRPKDFEGGSG